MTNKKEFSNSRKVKCEMQPEICFFNLEENTLKKVAKAVEKDEKIRREKVILL